MSSHGLSAWVRLGIWARVRGEARGAQEKGQWSLAPLGPLGPSGLFSPDPLKCQGDNSAHEKWAPEWAPMGPSWAPAGPSGGGAFGFSTDLLIRSIVRAGPAPSARSGPRGPMGPAPARSLSVWPGMFDNPPGVSRKLDLNGSPRPWRHCSPWGPPQQHVARWHAGGSNAVSLQGMGSYGAGTACQGRAIWHAGWHGPSGRAI